MVRLLAGWSAMATVWDLFPTFKQKFRNEIFSGCGFLVLKPEITEKKQSKIFRKTQKTTHWNQKITEYRHASKIWSLFLHLACQERGLHYWTPDGHNTFLDLFYILSLYKNRIIGIQSHKIVCVVRACNMQCILLLSCPIKSSSFAPMRNPVI